MNKRTGDKQRKRVEEKEVKRPADYMLFLIILWTFCGLLSVDVTYCLRQYKYQLCENEQLTLRYVTNILKKKTFQK